MNTPKSSPFIRQPHEEKIVFALSVLQVAVKNYGLVGLVGINTVSETFFRKFLNTAYGLNLANLNNGIANYPAIDLGDLSARLCFQVSSDGTKRKIQKTLKTFADPRHNLTAAYDVLRILVIGTKQKKYDGLMIPPGVTFSPSSDVIDIPKLIGKLPSMSTGQLSSLSQLIDQEMPMFATATSIEAHSDDAVLKEYRSFFCRRAMLDPWQQEENLADFRDAIDSLMRLLTSGYVDGKPVTKPIRKIVDRKLRGQMELVHLKLMSLRRLFTHHERVGDIDPATNYGNFQNPQICHAFDAYRQDVIDELNRALLAAASHPLPDIGKFP